MENQPNQSTKKGLILLLGVIIGLLAGVLVAFVVVQRFNLKTPSEVKVLPMPSTPASKDTVYQYIIHQYEDNRSDENEYSVGDSLETDSMYIQENTMDYMLEEDDYQEYGQKESANVMSERMISKYDAPVLYFDANRNAVSAPSNAPKLMEVQFWSTPFQNKIVYQFDNNKLKIKGLKPNNEVCLIHFKNRYYLQYEKRMYQIQPSTEYVRLVEIHDVSFF
ncbi:MAG: hypothetical protein J6S87_02835 [Bacteroidales bacterium]|nr:hypothetical protein [Bacteroidales bacterium]